MELLTVNEALIAAFVKHKQLHTDRPARLPDIYTFFNSHRGYTITRQALHTTLSRMVKARYMTRQSVDRKGPLTWQYQVTLDGTLALRDWERVADTIRQLETPQPQVTHA